MGSFVNLRGQRFGRLTALDNLRIPVGNGRQAVAWECLCDCGIKKIVPALHLRSSRVRSCGCLRAELSAARKKKHGYGRTIAYGAWKAMIRRCYNQNVDNYKFYGGRGIGVCDRWRFGEGGHSGYECFLADMGPRPDGMTLDRYPDNNGDYAPWNCRWATAKEQLANRRRS